MADLTQINRPSKRNKKSPLEHAKLAMDLAETAGSIAGKFTKTKTDTPIVNYASANEFDPELGPLTRYRGFLRKP